MIFKCVFVYGKSVHNLACAAALEIEIIDLTLLGGKLWQGSDEVFVVFCESNLALLCGARSFCVDCGDALFVFVHHCRKTQQEKLADDVGYRKELKVYIRKLFEKPNADIYTCRAEQKEGVSAGEGGALDDRVKDRAEHSDKVAKQEEKVEEPAEKAEPVQKELDL